MEYRIHKGEKLSEIGWGGYAMSGVYGKKDPEAFVHAILRAYDLGVNVFDVADVYGPAEETLGKAVAPFRKKVFISTKVGWGADGKPDCSSGHILTSCDKSLQRLGTNYIDLYQIHFDDQETPVEETVGALDKLKTAGKIRHYGVGHIHTSKMQKYFSTGKIFSAMMEFSAVARSAYENKIPLCQKNDVGIIAFSVTGRGLLAGNIEPGHLFDEGDIRRLDPLFQRERFASGLRVAEQIQKLSQKYGKTPVQIAIAWVLAHPDVFCALTGSSTIPHLEENMGASGLSLAPDDLDWLNMFLSEEERRMRIEQKHSLRALLEGELDSTNAFTDLVYVFETLVENDWAKEQNIMPLFLKLYAMREQDGVENYEQLKNIQTELRVQFLPILSEE